MNRTAQNSALGSPTIGGRGAVFSHFALTSLNFSRRSIVLFLEVRSKFKCSCKAFFAGVASEGVELLSLTGKLRARERRYNSGYLNYKSGRLRYNSAPESYKSGHSFYKTAVQATETPGICPVFNVKGSQGKITL